VGEIAPDGATIPADGSRLQRRPPRQQPTDGATPCSPDACSWSWSPASASRRCPGAGAAGAV